MMDKYKDRRRHERVPYRSPLQFTVLSVDPSNYAEFRRTQSEGEIVDASSSGIGIVTEFPLEPGHVLEWDDKHRRGALHIAMVRWAREQDKNFRAGLMFI